MYDLLRRRIVCRDRRTLERVWRQLLEALTGQKTCYRRRLKTEQLPGNESFPRIVRYANYFPSAARPHGSYFRTLNMTIALDATFAFEVQLLTENTNLYSPLDHPFCVAKTHTFPDTELQTWLEDLIWKANIIDAQKYLNSAN